MKLVSNIAGFSLINMKGTELTDNENTQLECSFEFKLSNTQKESLELLVKKYYGDDFKLEIPSYAVMYIPLKNEVLV